jgi:hypothetical protein
MGLAACYQAHDEGSEGSGRKPTLDHWRRVLRRKQEVYGELVQKENENKSAIERIKIRKTTRRTLTSPQHCCSDRSL